MVDINTLSLPDGEVVYSYKIHDLGNKKVFDFVQKIYSSCTSFGKKSVLVDALVYRADLDDVLTKFNSSEFFVIEPLSIPHAPVSVKLRPSQGPV